MVIPPFASPLDFTSALSPQGENDGYWYIFQEGHALILTSTDGKNIPTSPLPLKRSLYIGTLNNRHLFAGEIDQENQIPTGWAWKHLRSLFGVINDEHFAIAGRAIQLLEWDRAHQYCGYCGQATFIREKERCRECTSCGQLAFPKLAPAIMALVKRDTQILLARGPHFPENFYSVIAGFVDPGETLEQCVTREVSEEVGIKIKNIHYFGSQPWPFSHSLMIGFTCEWKSGDIRIDPSEITDAAWFNYNNLPQLPPPLSLSRIMIDAGKTTMSLIS